MAGELSLAAGEERILALITCPNTETSDALASAFLEQELAACVNIVPGISSVYRWEGQICRDSEHLLIVKTLVTHRQELLTLLKSIHPYEEPELLFLPVHSGSESYLTWFTKQISPRKLLES